MPKLISAEDELIRAMCLGSQQALECIIDRYTAYVGTIVWNIVRDRLTLSDAEEIVSDVFKTLWFSADKVRPGKLKGYLSVVARRSAINALRRGRREMPLEDDVVQIPVAGPEDESIQREEYEVLRKTVDEMPEPDRTIFIRHYYFCQKTAAIAKEMGLNVNTVQSKLRRGRENLRRKLTEGGYFIG